MLIRTLRRAEARVRRFGTNIHNIGKQLGTLGLALSAPFAASVKVFADFDDTMRAVKGVTGATGKEFDDLTAKAKFLGRTTSFTTHQVAEAMLQLGRAGFAPKEIDEAIPSILNLARATGTDLAQSAEICANTLRSFELPATEMVGAIAAALGRGDIEAAIGVIWASIKLIWTQGSTSLVSTWYWVTETLQTAWATCVFKISELLTTAWFGVQEFWTETVYTMQTLWIGFSNTVISAWKKAEESIAQGIGYIIAKMQGLDPNQMADILSQDYNRQAEQREAQKSQDLSAIQNNRDKKMASLKTEKDDTLGILRSDFEAGQKGRDSEYEAKISAQQKELDVAKAAYNDAITKAQGYSPWNMNTRTPNEDAVPSVFSDLQNKVQDAVKSFSAQGDLGSKVSVSGSFSAAAIAAMGQGTVMDRVAKATEKSEKHLAMMAEQNGAKDSSTKKPPEKEPVKNSDEHIVAKELKQHTRYLRDMARGGRVFA